MNENLNGNLLVAQSGGPTPVINASLAGVIMEALNHDEIEEVYGALNGVTGILNDNLVDLAQETSGTIELLKTTPGAALGSCRVKLKTEEQLAGILAEFQKRNIRYFHYIGGNDSQDSSHQIYEYCKSKGYEIRVIGVPKTIDNDLVNTDHCPGYGSTIKYLATSIRELACDCASLGNHDLVTIVEVMGRNAGWIAAGTVLARRKGMSKDAPHIILLPERAFNPEAFIAEILECLKSQKHCLVVAAEGLVDASGNLIGASNAIVDAFGHSKLGGVCDYLESLVSAAIQGVKTRVVRLGHVQRTASHFASKSDIDDAFNAGRYAVKMAVAGETGKMASFSRVDDRKINLVLVDLENVANGVRKLPDNYIGENGMSVNVNAFVKYVRPLTQGVVNMSNTLDECGIPQMAILKSVPVK
ncbi:MAG: 6-phosphofructokinase [Opitutales bacterium]|nr:6-phosphofructokinase [Opitutales bacterium]